MAVPMPWPTYSRTTLNPARSTVPCTAAPRSPSRLPGTSSAMPASSAARVTSMSRWASSSMSPTPAVKAASPW